MTSKRLSPRITFSLAAIPLLAFTACGTQDNTDKSSKSSSSAATTSSGSSEAAAAAGNVGKGEKEVSSVSPRVLLADADGLHLRDADTGKVLAQHKASSFLRLSDAGDGRHVMVTDGDTFRVFDTGIELKAHGDHDHAYTYKPGLTQATYKAPHAGHAVPHGGTMVLFGDGDGSIQMVDMADLAKPGAEVTRTTTDAPHHGVAVWLGGHGLLTTQGTEKSRNTVQVKQGDKVVAQTTDCPGVHGEATAAESAGPVVVVGCENGPVIYRSGAFHKVKANDAYARTGNAAGSPKSPFVLMDYKVDKDAEHERPTRVAIVDTRKDSMKLVELGSSYWFRSLARGPQGEALVLTYDGSIAVIDPAAAKVTKRIKAIAPWTEKEDWKQPGPVLKVAGERAYVTDAAKNELVVVDLKSSTEVKRHSLPKPAVEMAVVSGASEHDHSHEGHNH